MQEGPFQGQQPPQGQWQQQPFPSGQYPQQSPYPQQYGQQPPFMQPPATAPKKKRGKGLLVGSIIVVAAILICVIASVAASRGGNVAATKVGSVSNTSDVTPTAIPTQTSAYKVGDVVKVGNAWTVTITSAQVSNGDATYQPESGKRYLVLNLSMVNLTNENHTISSIIQFTLRGDDGTKYDVALYPDGGSQIDGDVNGGQPAKGVIVYSIPTNVSTFHLTFESNPMEPNTPQATWNLKV